MLRWFLVCVICNSKSFHSFIFKLCILIVHTLDMCLSFFVQIFRAVELGILSQVWCLIVSIPEIWPLYYLDIFSIRNA